MSLRQLPLLRNTGQEYEEALLNILSDKVRKLVKKDFDYDFLGGNNVYEIQSALAQLSQDIKKRMVIFFDDAAHIGREAGLEEFFYSVLESRFQSQINTIRTTKETNYHVIATFLGKAVVGNVRSFVRACSFMFETTGNIGMQTLTNTFIKLASDYYWPMLEEISLKLGIYEVMITPSEELVNSIYKACGNKEATSCIVHRNIVNKLSKLFEILEYAGFISRREASRAMKSGGRGTRYALNLCNMLENMPGSRLTKELYEKWDNNEVEDVQFSQGSALAEIGLPELDETQSLKILDLPIEKLKKSNVFPYGITDNKLELLKGKNLLTVGNLAEISDAELLKIDGVGEKTVERFRNVLGQAIWM